MPCPFLPPSFLLTCIYLVALALHCCVWTFFGCGELASHCGGFFCCRALALGSFSLSVLPLQPRMLTVITCPALCHWRGLCEQLWLVSWEKKWCLSPTALGRCSMSSYWAGANGQVCFCCWWGAEMCKAQTLPWRSSTIVSGTHEVVNMKSVW